MKKAIVLLVSAVLLSGVGVTFTWAQQDQISSTAGRPSEGEVGLDISHITYKEPGIMEEKGMMYGVSGSYARHNNDFMFKVDGRFAAGQVDYDGRLSDGTPYTFSNINDYLFETRLAIGYDYEASSTVFVTPYLGLGYRYLFDGMSKSPSGYDRESNYLYCPIGIDVIASLDNGWSIGLIGEYDLFLYGLQKSHFEQAYAGVDVLNSDQRRGFGVRGSVRIQKKSESLNIVIEPYVRYWSIQQSDTSAISFMGTYVIGYGYEPKNNSTECGVRLGLIF